jgi:hypothetical protein
MPFGTPTADTRYTFTGQYLEAAALFVRRARRIERRAAASISERLRCEHRGLVSTAIMQCAAALETESHELCKFGPGSHLGSNGTDHLARDLLLPLADVIDDQDTLSRFDLILHLLGKGRIDHGAEPYQSASLVVRLRNELVHYKSHWGAQMTRTKLFLALEGRGHTPPPFTHASMNFFPHRCLGADCGAWAVTSTVAYLEQIYSLLGVESRFKTYRRRLKP